MCWWVTVGGWKLEVGDLQAKAQLAYNLRYTGLAATMQAV